MNNQTFNFLTAKGYNPNKFIKNKPSISQLGHLKDSRKECLLYVCEIFNQTFMISPKTGVHTLNEGLFNERVREHWQGFLINQ